MRKITVMSTSDDMFDKCDKRVVIHRESQPENPLKEYDQVFYLHSCIDALCGNEDDQDYESPLVPILDEDGYETGKFKFKEGVVHFPVSAYIHSGIALSLGTVRCAFGDVTLPGCSHGCDTTPNCAFMWTDKERFEDVCGPWMEIYDTETKERRPAKDEKEFVEYLHGIAENELNVFQDFLDGNCYWFDTELKLNYTKTYDDGETVEGHEWEDGDDSCGGYYIEKVGDMDFPKDEGWYVFADEDCSNFVGDVIEVPEYLVVDYHVGGHEDTPMYLKSMTKDGNVFTQAWTEDVNCGELFSSMFAARNAMQDASKTALVVEKDNVMSKKGE